MVALGIGGAVSERELRFAALLADVEPRLRRALVAAYGVDAGSDATAEALGWAWEHLDAVVVMRNPGGYLWRVGSTAARRARPRTVAWQERPDDALETSTPEPAVAAALASLSPRQRAAVLLVHGYGYSLTEAADLLGCRVRTVRTHLDRGMAVVRAALGVTIGDDDA